MDEYMITGAITLIVSALALVPAFCNPKEYFHGRS